MQYGIRGFVMSLILINSPLQAQENEADIYKRMIGNAIVSTMEEHHASDWKTVETTASHFWRDPTSALDQEVRALEGKFYRFLNSTLLGDEASVKKILKHYFEYQLDRLVGEYQKAPVSRYQFWSKLPSHGHAILAFQLLAVERGIKLDENYHQLFSLASERARLIEEESHKIAEAAVAPLTPPPAPPPPVVRSIIPDAPISPSLKLKHPTRDRPQKPRKSGSLSQAELSATLSGLKKTTTRTGSSSLSENVLQEIKKGGFNLKPASDRILKELPIELDNSLESILRRRFANVRPLIEGEDYSCSNCFPDKEQGAMCTPST